MCKKLLFLAVQFLSLVSSKLALAQDQNSSAHLLVDDRGVLTTSRIGQGTGTCLVSKSREDVKLVLEQMSERQIKEIFDSLKTEEDRKNLLQLLEEVQ